MVNLINTNISYHYCDKGVTLINKFKNTISIEDVLKGWQEAINAGMINSNVKGVISDFSECYSEIDQGDLDKIFNFMQSNIHLLLNLKLAVVMDSPQVALAVLFKKRYHVTQLKVFSTSKAAINWITNEPVLV